MLEQEIKDIKSEKVSEEKAKVAKPEEQKIVSKSKLLEAGTYFGHKASFWNPKMKPYIHTKKAGIHIIDIAKTQHAIEMAYNFIYKYALKGANFIFVGTKKQAKKTVKEQALRTNSAYVSERWLGGTLTNSKTIFSSLRKLQELEKQAETNYEGYTKKEGVLKSKELAKLQKNLEGIRHMRQQPQIMIVADPQNDLIAIKEARKKNVRIFGILDSNADPALVDFGIPANDDSAKSIALIFTILADAIVAAKNGTQLFAYQPDEMIVLPVDPNKDQRKTWNTNRNSHYQNNQNRDYNRTARPAAPAVSEEKTEQTKAE